MMTVLQNAFSNTASSLIQSKISGESRLYSSAGHPGTAGGRGLYRRELRALSARWRRALSALLLVGISPVREPGLLIAFGFFGAAIMAALGLITALWAEKYDQMGSGDEFRHHAAHLPFGRLFIPWIRFRPSGGPREPPQSLLLLGRRLSAGIFSGAATPTRR